ncbi:CD276 antigen-like isoform X3 [Protopterus annectens]|nr:CD276 antigen-like isoform X3 [Protopterus annectens]
MQDAGNMSRQDNASVSFILSILAVCQCGASALEIIADKKQNALLPCIFAVDQFNMKELVITWQLTLNRIVVHSFLDESDHPEYQNKRYKGRTHLFPKEFNNGNATLFLKEVEDLDSTNYTCFVHIDDGKDKYTKHVNLKVVDSSTDEKMDKNTRLRIALVCPAAILLLYYLYLPKKTNGKYLDACESMHWMQPEMHLCHYKESKADTQNCHSDPEETLTK